MLVFWTIGLMLKFDGLPVRPTKRAKSVIGLPDLIGSPPGRAACRRVARFFHLLDCFDGLCTRRFGRRFADVFVFGFRTIMLRALLGIAFAGPGLVRMEREI